MVSIDEKQALPPHTSSDGTKSQRYVLVIHGGAGTMSKEKSTPEQRAHHKAGLAKALEAGYAVLKEGGEAMDAAVAAVSSMEGMCAGNNGRVRHTDYMFSDCPIFNAGKGAVFNVEGKVCLHPADRLSP